MLLNGKHTENHFLFEGAFQSSVSGLAGPSQEVVLEAFGAKFGGSLADPVLRAK